MLRPGRPCKKRSIEAEPIFNSFKPRGIPSSGLETVTLLLDEYEAFRIADHLGERHEDGAVLMDISRPVFTRLLESAHRKIGEAIVLGKILSIEGGPVRCRKMKYRCAECQTISVMKEPVMNGHCPHCGSSRIESAPGGKCCNE